MNRANTRGLTKITTSNSGVDALIFLNLLSCFYYLFSNWVGNIHGQKNRFFRLIYCRKIDFWLAPRRKSRGKSDMRKNRGKSVKSPIFCPKIRNHRFFHRKNQTWDSCAKDARHLQKIGDKLKKSVIFYNFCGKKLTSDCFLFFI